MQGETDEKGWCEGRRGEDRNRRDAFTHDDGAALALLGG